MAYRDIILDDSVLDIDSWFPQEAIDEIVKIIKEDLERQSTEPLDENVYRRAYEYLKEVPSSKQ